MCIKFTVKLEGLLFCLTKRNLVHQSLVHNSTDIPTPTSLHVYVHIVVFRHIMYGLTHVPMCNLYTYCIHSSVQTYYVRTYTRTYVRTYIRIVHIVVFKHITYGLTHVPMCGLIYVCTHSNLQTYYVRTYTRSYMWTIYVCT